jgi:hypothetical protein
MISDTETTEILQVLKKLPPEKVVEVRDFAVFLQSQYEKSQTIDESDEWTDEDLQDFTASSRFVEESEKYKLDCDWQLRLIKKNEYIKRKLPAACRADYRFGFVASGWR